MSEMNKDPEKVISFDHNIFLQCCVPVVSMTVIRYFREINDDVILNKSKFVKLLYRVVKQNPRNLPCVQD